MVMRLNTATEVAATAVKRFGDAYANTPPDWRFSESVGGRTVDETKDLLVACDQTPSGIAGILNAGWAYPNCTACGEHRTAVVEFRDEWSEDRTAAICKPCAEHALRILAAIPDAGEKIKDPQS